MAAGARLCAADAPWRGRQRGAGGAAGGACQGTGCRVQLPLRQRVGCTHEPPAIVDRGVPPLLVAATSLDFMKPQILQTSISAGSAAP